MREGDCIAAAERARFPTWRPCASSVCCWLATGASRGGGWGDGDHTRERGSIAEDRPRDVHCVRAPHRGGLLPVHPAKDRVFQPSQAPAAFLSRGTDTGGGRELREQRASEHREGLSR